jgi:hypothetical protein
MIPSCQNTFSGFPCPEKPGRPGHAETLHQYDYGLYGGRKIALRHPTEWADPVITDAFKGSPRGYAAVGIPRSGIVYISAYITYIFLHIHSF